MYVYLLRSKTHPDQRYVGLTGDLAKRLAEHDAGLRQRTCGEDKESGLHNLFIKITASYRPVLLCRRRIRSILSSLNPQCPKILAKILSLGSG